MMHLLTVDDATRNYDVLDDELINCKYTDEWCKPVFYVVLIDLEYEYVDCELYILSIYIYIYIHATYM